MEIKVYQKDSTANCWVNQYTGKDVLITFPLTASSLAGGTQVISGKVLRIDQFGHRYYLVITQNPDAEEIHEISINIDHIMVIEEK